MAGHEPTQHMLYTGQCLLRSRQAVTDTDRLVEIGGATGNMFEFMKVQQCVIESLRERVAVLEARDSGEGQPDRGGHGRRPL